jgi:elongation factor Tu
MIMYKLNAFLFAAFFSLVGFNAGKESSFSYSTSGEPFLMAVQDVFTVTGRGLLVSGVIEKGMIRVGDTVELVGSPAGGVIKAAVKVIELFHKSVSEAKKGETVGLLFSNVESKDVSRGMVVCHPGTAKVYSEFRCKLHLNSKEEGGRTAPVADKYRPLFVLRTALVSGEITLPAGTQSLQPGDDAEVMVLLLVPTVMEKGMEFLIREGNRAVGKGKIVSVIR